MARSIPVLLAALLFANAALAQSWDDGNWAGEDDLSVGAAASGYAQGEEADYVPDSGPSMRDFRQGLDSYGEWIDTADYGAVWRPTSVDSDWRPYYTGRWVWTNLGWTWASEEPFGWAVYHYGRWAFVDGAGWVWLPGRVWAPAWVAWRWGGGYAGWCPLGPRAIAYSEPTYWVFVDTPHFLAPVPHYAAPISAVRAIYPRATAIPISQPGPRAGPVSGAVARATGQPIHAIPIVDSPGPRATVAGATVQMYRPRSVAIPLVARSGTPQRGPSVDREPRIVAPNGTRTQGGPPRASGEQGRRPQGWGEQAPAPRGWGEPHTGRGNAPHTQPSQEQDSPRAQSGGEPHAGQGAGARMPAQTAPHAQRPAATPHVEPAPAHPAKK